MTIQKFDKTETVLNHCDRQIHKAIAEGKSFDFIIADLKDKYKKFQKVRQNCDSDQVRYKYLYTLTRVYKKRIKDLYDAKGLSRRFEEYSNYSQKKLFNLIQFRDKLSPRKFSVTIS